MHGCICEIWCRVMHIHTSRGSPALSLNDDLLVVVDEFERLFKGGTREREDAEPSVVREAQESLLCNRK